MPLTTSPMTRQTMRQTTRTAAVAGAALSLTLGVSACADPAEDDGAAPEQTAAEDTERPEAGSDTADRLTGEDIHEDPERFVAVSESMQQEFPALADQSHPAPVVLGLHVCSVLWEAQDEGRDVQARYDQLVEDFAGDGYVSDETGQHWVEYSVQELCPDLEPELSR